jgi:hypothetical protein
MEPELENSTREIDFNRLNVQLECEDFIECKGISQQELEEDYYYFKKKEYLEKLVKWESMKTENENKTNTLDNKNSR